eukprot:TRINITY_DN7319_c0_g3_i4.p1 TRINITY_DN7319_c0_g3~~TRINITY_DN7319_c0_g3_i4.p1  ORF type:complete len:1150 (-),score=195.51 TRINITY_DN7319_c0_g3_i4:290-3739(-)
MLSAIAATPSGQVSGIGADSSAIQTAANASSQPSAVTPSGQGSSAGADSSTSHTAASVSSQPSMLSATAVATPSGQGSGIGADSSAIQTAANVSSQPSMLSTIAATPSGQSSGVRADSSAIHTAANVSSQPSTTSAAAVTSSSDASGIGAERSSTINSSKGNIAEVPSQSSAANISTTGGTETNNKGNVFVVQLQSSAANGSTAGHDAATLPGLQISSSMWATQSSQTLNGTDSTINGSKTLELQHRAAQLSGLLSEAVTEQNLTSLQEHLANISLLLQENATLLDLSNPLLVMTKANSFDNQSEGKDIKALVSSRTCSALGATAKVGWLLGAKTIIEWDQGRQDAGNRLDIAAGGCSGDETNLTNLQLAQGANAYQMVRYLAEQNASVMTRYAAGLTPLEVAVRQGSLEMVLALLDANGSELHAGLLNLRLRLLKAAEDLPYLLDWWSLQDTNSSEEDGLDALRKMVPAELVPKADELEVVGNVPYDWVTFYQISVMHQNAASSNTTSQHQVEELLIEQGFAAFAWTYYVSTATITLMVSCFGLLFWAAFRLRVYGSLETPISLADLIPGAFDPSRLADPDFDPCRQKQTLPYRQMKDQLPPRSCPNSMALCIFGKALAGVYSSWLFQYVRIPPEQDLFDEEYLSDDDEDSRLKIRKQYMAKAKSVQTLEVVLRTLCNCALICWLVFWARRPAHAFILVLLHFCYAWIACVAATCSLPVAEPETTGAASDPDAANVVHGLFGVQLGPRWTRAICTARSTAAPNKKKRVQRRPRRGKASTAAADSSSGNELTEKSGTYKRKSNAQADIDHTSSVSKSALEGEALPAMSSSSSDRFQRQLLNSGVLHISHHSYLELCIGTMVSTFIAIVWLFQFRYMSTGSYQGFYEMASPLQILQAYGNPQSGFRCLALTAEMLLMWLCGERLCGIASLLHVATLSVRQRSAAVNFLREHRPHLGASGALDAVDADSAHRYCLDAASCSEFALELSTARWHLLQQPVSLVFVLTEILLLSSMLLLALPRALSALQGPAIAKAALPFLDPAMPLTLGLVLVWPTAGMLVAACAANAEIHRQRLLVRSQAEVALSSASMNKEEADVKYVQLRLQSQKVMANATLKWGNGRELGAADISVLALTVAAAIGWALMQNLDFVFP